MNKIQSLQKEIIHLKKLLNKYKKYSFVDMLTGLYNRRKFDIDFIRLNSLHIRYGYKYIILFIDLNKFKRYNDIYGHKYGDSILQRFSEHLKKVIRKTDRIYRYGGDEFVCILHGEKEELSTKFFVRLKNINIAFSFGITNLEKNINKVDKIMYKNKRGF